jgi:glucose-6-phosphate 1-dehydrogenase
MEAPASLDAQSLRLEKNRAIQAVRVQSPAEALANSVRGQYGAGIVEGRPMEAYRAAPNVDPQSRTETYAALKLTIDNERWSGVPFYLRTGKAMSARDTEIAIRFKAPSQALFGAEAAALGANFLVLQIQPEESISIHFAAKRPGLDMQIEDVRMDFRYRDFFKMEASSGYETLLYDCMIGDQTLFPEAETIERGWWAVMPFLQAWDQGGGIAPYAAGADGPAQAQDLLARDGRRWRPVGGVG